MAFSRCLRGATDLRALAGASRAIHATTPPAAALPIAPSNENGRCAYIVSEPSEMPPLWGARGAPASGPAGGGEGARPERQPAAPAPRSRSAFATPFPPRPSRNFTQVKTTQAWKASPSGLVLNTKQQFGLDIGLARMINKRILKGWAGSEDPIKK
jgi:hypothetical protein